MPTPFDAFGPGAIMVTRTDVANSTPVNIGYANEFTADFAANVKQLYGQYQYPIDAARGTVKVTGKMKAAVLSGLAWNTVFFGNSFTTGSVSWSIDEAATIPGTPYQVTVAQAANFDTDLGVRFATSNLPLVKVASGPTTGQYSVNSATGIYTFAAADTTKTLLINYAYKLPSTGQTLAITQQLLGASPVFQLDYYTIRNTKPLVLRFPQCQANKITLAAKLEDFIMPELDIEMFADSTGTLGKMYFPEVS